MIPDTEILNRTSTISVEAQILKHRLRWTGHVMRMKDGRLPKLAFLSVLREGKRGVGRPLLRYKDQVKSSLADCKIEQKALEAQGAPNITDPEGLRERWRKAVSEGVTYFETTRIETASRKRAIRKQRQAPRCTAPASTTTTDQPQPTAQSTTLYIKCHICEKDCKGARGLAIHITKSHSNQH